MTEARKKVDFAHCMQDLVDGHFPKAQVIRVVLDNLNIHTPGSLYEAFEPAEARRIYLTQTGISRYAQTWQLAE